ncbi:MAG TPA: hypothetical protein VFM08_13480 [Nocardioides sp.]|jgi:hypothetical protein|nr:hypothetical protein [Nocardioides sp.]
MTTASLTHQNSFALSAAIAAFVAALAFTGVTIAQHDDGSPAPARTTDTGPHYPVYSLERPWHSGIQVGLP